MSFNKGSASVQGKFSLCPLALSLLVSLSQQAENRLKVISKFTAGYLFGWMGRSLKLLKPTESDETSEANDVHEGVLSQGLGLISYLLKQPGNAVVMSSQLVKLSTRFFRKCVSESGGCHYNTSPLDGLLDEYLELLVSAQTVADLGRFISIKSVQPLLLMMSQIGIEMESHFDFGGRRLKRFSQLMRVISHAFRVSCEEPGASKFIDEVRAFFQGFSDEDMSRLNALLDRLGKRDSELKVIGQEILGCLVRRLPKIHTVPDFVLMKESAHGKMPGTSFCSAWCVNSEDKSRWFVKAGALNSAERAKVEAVLENISGRVYQFLGAQTPETQMSVLNIHRHFRYPHADWFMSCDSQRITNTHIHFTLSKAVPKALSLSALPKFEGQPVLTITGEKGEVRVVSGLGHILAVADFLGDVDVLGGLGNNVLYQALPGKAKCWKIDHGYALTFRHNPIPKRYIRVAALGPDVAFESLPGNVKREYLETLAKIKVLPDDQIAEFFNTPGSRILHGHELPDCLIPSEMIKELILRRDLLSVVYQKDLVEQAPLTCGCSIWSHAVNDTQKNTMFAIKHTV